MVTVLPLTVQTEGLPLVNEMAPDELLEMSITKVPLATKGATKLLNNTVGRAFVMLNDASIIPRSNVSKANCVARIFTVPADKIVTLFPLTVAMLVSFDVYLNAPEEVDVGALRENTDLGIKLCDEMVNADKLGADNTDPAGLIDKVVVAVPDAKLLEAA